MSAAPGDVYRLSDEVQWEPAPDGEICKVSDGRAALSREDALALRFFRNAASAEEFLDHVAHTEAEKSRWSSLLKQLFVLRILVLVAPDASYARRALVERANDQCDQLFFLFAGGFGAMGAAGSNINFLRSSQLWERNFVLFRDFRGARYLRGISREIDSFTSLLQWQERHRAGLPHVKHTYHLGNSMGAGTAIMCGHFLRADAVYAFSPGWIRYEPGAREDPEHVWDLRALLASYNGVTQYHVFYSASHERDRANATQLSGAPGVTLHPIETDAHNVLEWLAANDAVASILPPVESHGR